MGRVCLVSATDHNTWEWERTTQVERQWERASERIYIYTYTAHKTQDKFAIVSFSVGERGWRVQIVYEGTGCLAWGVIFGRRRHRGVVCVFSIFNAVGSVCGCMCVYTHTHTHTAHMGYSVVSPGVGMRHLEGPMNADALNLGIHVTSFIYVYKVHMCMYMPGSGMRSCNNSFFLEHIFLPKKKSQRCERQTTDVSNPE